MTEAQRIQAVERLSRPDTYAEDRLGMKLHPTQAAVLRAMFQPKSKSRVVFRCANEVGKTRRVVTAAVLYAIEIKGAQVVSTAGAFRQVSEQLIPSLKSYADRYDPKRFQFLDSAIKRHNGRVWMDAYTGFSAKDEHYFQGFHRDENMPLLIIIDESQGVPNEIALAAEDRCNPTYFLACGSPGDPQGFFYDMETRLAAHYKHFKLTRPECTKDKEWFDTKGEKCNGWIDPADIQRMIAKHGEDNPFVRSTIFAEFTTSVENALLSLGEYDQCLSNAPRWLQNGIRHAFCDFAAGRDKNVLAFRNGNKVEIIKKWTDRNTMAAVGEFVTLFSQLQKEHGLQAHEISGDADGLGLPMVQRIQEVGWQINEFHGGQSPRFEDGYRNAIAETWGEGAAKVKRMEIILPDDLDFKAQILGRKSKRNSSGKLEIESKEDMKKRGLSSPDEADAVLGAMMPAPQARSFSLIKSPQVPSWQQEIDDPERVMSGERRYFT